MPDDLSLRELLAKHQEGMAGASIISLLSAVAYARIKGLDLWRSLQAASIGAFFATGLWVFLSEYLGLKIYFIIPVAMMCGFGAFPIVSAYVRKDDALADDVVSGAKGFLSLVAKFFGGSK